MSNQPNDTTGKEEFLEFRDTALTVSEDLPLTYRQLLIGALLATSIGFIIAMLALPRLDRPLTVALIAFVAGIPFLGMAYIFLQLSMLDTFKKPNNKPAEFGFAVIHSFSYVPVVVGFCAMLLHFGVIVFLGLVAGFFAAVLLGALGQMLYWKAQGKQHGKGVSLPRE